MGREKTYVHVGVELPKKNDFSVKPTKVEFARSLKPYRTSPELWPSREHPLSSNDAKLRQCKAGELCWLATEPPPGICARSPQIAPRVNAQQGSDIYRINELAKTVAEWQQAAVLKYASLPQSGAPASGDVEGRMRGRGETIHRGSMSFVGHSDAVHGDQSAAAKCRLGCVRGLTSFTLNGPCHIIQWASKITRKSVETSLGGQVYAFSEMGDRVTLPGELYDPCADMSPGMIRFGHCGRLFIRLEQEKTFAQNYVARHLLGTQQSSGNSELDNAYRLPGTEQRAAGLTKVKIDVSTLPC